MFYGKRSRCDSGKNENYSKGNKADKDSDKEAELIATTTTGETKITRPYRTTELTRTSLDARGERNVT